MFAKQLYLYTIIHHTEVLSIERERELENFTLVIVFELVSFFFETTSMCG